MFDLTIVICSHNPRADFLNRTLRALQEQTLPLENWELLLVDNASAKPLAASWDLSWHCHGRHISEHELGLSAARQRGMQEAASDLLIFVDDDNVLDGNYLRYALEIKQSWPTLGVWGSGVINPEYELPPDAYVKRLLPYLAVRTTEKPCWSNVFSAKKAIPWGAGLCVRSKVANAYRRICNESEIVITGRRGDALLGSEDDEISRVACHYGLGMGVFPELKLTHLIAKKRVSPEYLLQLYEGIELPDVLLEYKWTGITPSSPYRPLNLLRILKNLVVQRGIDRRIYLANVRALVVARRIILSSHPRPSSDSVDYRR